MQRYLIHVFLHFLYMFQAVPLPIMLFAAIEDEMELFHLIHDSSKQQYWLTIPEAVCTVMCS